MIYDRHSIDYQINIEALHEMELVVPMTLPERTRLRKWVRSGHEVESNPWGHIHSDGSPLNFLQALRLEYGYSSGPWDNWKGPEHQTLWCHELGCFLPEDEL